VPSPHALGEYVRLHREKAGLSNRGLADLVAVHHSFMTRLESGVYARPDNRDPHASGRIPRCQSRHRQRGVTNHFP
jgi:hypothetical protein